MIVLGMQWQDQEIWKRKKKVKDPFANMKSWIVFGCPKEIECSLKINNLFKLKLNIRVTEAWVIFSGFLSAPDFNAGPVV